MNALIESLNLWGARFLDFAPSSLWQSSLLMALVLVFDFALRRKMRPVVRYALWFVVFIKLISPPTLALPTGAAWWLRGRDAATPPAKTVMIRYRARAARAGMEMRARAQPPILLQTPPAELDPDGWILIGAVGISGLLLAWSLVRWRQIARCVRNTTNPPENISKLLQDVRNQAGMRDNAKLRLMATPMSPAVCGLFRPVILLPQSLVERLTEKQLRAVLLHELIHLRRGDVWVNCAQTLLQIVYWWHPLLWFANARVRRLREESVDDAVMIALNDEAEIYAPTLLEVAKLAFNRPLAALGLVGILESRSALRHRIERLLNFTTPRRAGLSVGSIIGITAFTALAVPMGEPPARVAQSASPEPAHVDSQEVKKEVLIEAQFYQLRSDDKFKLVSASLHREANSTPWWHLLPNELEDVRQQFKNLGVPLLSAPRIQTSDNVPASLFVGDGTNNIQWDCSPLVHGNEVDLTTLARTTGKYAPDGKGWPDLGDKTNCAIYARMNIPSGDGVLLEAEHPGTVRDNLILLLSVKIVEPPSKGKLPFLGDMPGVGHLFRSGPNTTTTNTVPPTVPNDQVKTLVADGKLLYQMGNLDEAETKLNEALAVQPDNQEALYYLGLIKQQQMRAAVDAHNGGGLKVIPNPPVRTNTIRARIGRQKIYDKLNAITFDSVSYPGLTLEEVILKLQTETQERDPDHQGMNFVLNRTKPQSTFDPMTGAPIMTTPPPGLTDVDLGKVRISLQPRLQEVKLFDVLEGIVKASNRPIKYSLLNDGVEFSWKGPETPELHIRTFKVNPRMFYEVLLPTQPKTFSGGTAPKYNATASDVQTAVINFFESAGVNLVAPKSVFFNDREGTLQVRATEDDLGLIEQAVSFLNPPPPQLTIKVRFVEVETNFAQTQGLDWYLGPQDHDHPWPSMATLNVQQFRTILKTLKERNGATLLSEGEVTTLSGREAQLEFTDTVTNANKDVINKRSIIDLMGTVTPDGKNIQMYLNPNWYLTLAPGSPSSPVWTEPSNSIPVMTLSRALPPGRMVNTPTNWVVGDGKTIVLGNFRDSFSFQTPEGISKTMDFFEARKKRLLVFVTPTLIDASGNRIHSKDYYDDPVLQ